MSESLETPTQVFSGEYCEIFKNTCLEEYLQMAASITFFGSLGRDMKKN